MHTTILDLHVRNHPGAMSHITGLFARRAFNLEAIFCAPQPDGATSRILLLVADEPKLDQVERQLAKLHDVLAVRQRDDLDPGIFAALGAKLTPSSSQPSEACGCGGDCGCRH